MTVSFVTESPPPPYSRLSPNEEHKPLGELRTHIMNSLAPESFSVNEIHLSSVIKLISHVL